MINLNKSSTREREPDVLKWQIMKRESSLVARPRGGHGPFYEACCRGKTNRNSKGRHAGGGEASCRILLLISGTDRKRIHWATEVFAMKPRRLQDY